ncbi:Metallo-beta-lactamase L1 type 3 [Ensifer adhaerens]|uniref:subclass B3 metallo-beta-lactamase n=1 Tax=Ensifer adhaerens TaxID=106592 RepID=UPI001EFF2881|nr:subclass B3 metallo-beta-lactamase [Ensifer adhaerens]NRP22430.1 Metallo-beta-lactamase L1 type 3 [Ensifer adhaerens]
MRTLKRLGLATVVATFCMASAATADNADWSRPTKPFRVVGNIYYVGTKGLSAYLITSGRKAILLDGTLKSTAALVEDNIAALGFKLSDVKIIVTSHAHYDHVAGVAQIKRDSGAKLHAIAADRWALENGLHGGETSYKRGTFPPVKVDHVLADGDAVTLGDVSMKATLTAGHTPGCTTWSTSAIEDGRALKVVFPCSVTVAGNKLFGNRRYPGIVGDFEVSFDRLAAMKADVVLPAHPEFADVLGRAARRDAGDKDAFVDPGLLGRIVEQSRAAFKKELARQKARQ